MINKTRISALMQLAMLAGLDFKEPDLDWDLIEKEYDLITKKKSCLSASKRRCIVKVWENRNKVRI